MDSRTLSDQEFLNLMEHHFRHQYMPPFGDRTFFNSGLFHYIIHEAAENLPHLNREMEKLRHRFGTDSHKIKMRVYTDPPTIGIKLFTPSEARKIKITDGEIAARTMAPDEDL